MRCNVIRIDSSLSACVSHVDVQKEEIQLTMDPPTTGKFRISARFLPNQNSVVLERPASSKKLVDYLQGILR